MKNNEFMATGPWNANVGAHAKSRPGLNSQIRGETTFGFAPDEIAGEIACGMEWCRAANRRPVHHSERDARNIPDIRRGRVRRDHLIVDLVRVGVPIVTCSWMKNRIGKG
jgi:hypothetical protein